MWVWILTSRNGIFHAKTRDIAFVSINFLPTPRFWMLGSTETGLCIYKINTQHGFAPDFPSPDVYVGILSIMFSHPGF
jgi:hypothetical protein